MRIASRFVSSAPIWEVQLSPCLHVTIAHHLPEAQLERAFVELERYDARFDVTEMWMYLHDEHAGWRPSRSFPLNGSA